MVSFSPLRPVRLPPAYLLDAWRVFVSARCGLLLGEPVGSYYPIQSLPALAQQARSSLIQHYYYLVGCTRLKILPIVPVRIRQEDVEQEATIGLIRAVDRFDPSRRVKFETFAIATVRGAILEYLRQDDWAPRAVRQAEKRLRRAQDALNVSGQSSVEVSALAVYLQLSDEDVYAMIAEAALLNVVSLDEWFAAADGEEPHDRDYRYPCDAAMFDAGLLDDARRDALIGAIARLPSQVRVILVLYYFDGLNLQQVSKRVARTQGQVEHILQDGRSALKDALGPVAELFGETNTESGRM